jgi:hypothetical protein
MQHPERIYAAHDDGLPIVLAAPSRRIDQLRGAGTTASGIISEQHIDRRERD